MKQQEQNVVKATNNITVQNNSEQSGVIEVAYGEDAGLSEFTECEEQFNKEVNKKVEKEVMELQDAINIGRIDIAFPESSDEFSNSVHCYPPSYYTLSSKERLLLLFAENFRRQFVANNSKRRPLVLALPNECNVQKFVCTTIRPTAFLHTPLIRNAKECAHFVADFIHYERLENMMHFVNSDSSDDEDTRKQNFILERKHLRQKFDIFNLPDSNYFRVNKTAFKYVLETITSNLISGVRSTYISKTTTLAATLSFVAQVIPTM